MLNISVKFGEPTEFVSIYTENLGSLQEWGNFSYATLPSHRIYMHIYFRYMCDRKKLISFYTDIAGVPN